MTILRHFDKVKQSDAFDILLRHKCYGKDLRVIRNSYWEQEATIRIDDDCSVYKPICRGVRQGCVFSPDLFNIYSEMILRNMKRYEGVRVGGNNINNLRHADDTVLLLIADSEEKLQNILIKVTFESENKGLRLNAKKTECMVTLKQSDISVCNILCKGERIIQIGTFKYLGFTITPDTEIKKRIALSKDTCTKIKSIFTNRRSEYTPKSIP